MRFSAVLLCLWASPAISGEVVVENCREPSQLRDFATCDITNNLDMAISALSYSVRIYSTERSVPWFDSNDDYPNRPVTKSISGGVEPDETIEEWFKIGTIPLRAKEASDLIIEITPITATDATGSVIALQSPPSDD